ncbi:MAG: dihydrofolate reductase [Rhodothermales bacterium]
MPMSEIIHIAALGEDNRVIGRGMDLPWHLPEDLKRFKRLTVGHPLVMGRTTFDAVLHQFGRPLPKRRNVILSRRGAHPQHPEIEVYDSVEAVIHALRDEPTVYIGGGGTVYTQFLPHATRLELTLVDGAPEGDVFFPEYAHLIDSVFEQTFEERHDGFRFVTYDRKSEAS